MTRSDELELISDAARKMKMKRHAKSLVRVLHERFGNSNIRGVEVGVSQGELSESLLIAFPNLTLYMVDGWELLEKNPTQSKSGKNRMTEERKTAEKRTWDYGHRRVIVKALSVNASYQFMFRSLDFVFVDACHLYEFIKEDIEVWAPKIKSGGILSGHDYNGMGDKRKGWGVKRAVDEWASVHGHELFVEPGLVWWIRV